MASTTATPPSIEATPAVSLRMSYDEYQAWYGEGQRGEWVDGEVIPFVATSDRHQRILSFLFGVLMIYVDLRRLGRVFSQTFEVRTREGAAREPDLLVVFNQHLDRVQEMRLLGPADLAVEIISPDSVTRDRRDKLAEYAAAGIPEYWLVDPRAGKEQLDAFHLDPEGYYVPIEADADGRLRSIVLPGVWIDPAWLTIEELPSVTRLGMEMAEAAPPTR